MMQMEKKKNTSAVLITVLVVCTVIVFTVIVLPHFWPNYHTKSYCSYAESDANNIAAAIADYFADPKHTDIKPGDLYEGISTENPWTFVQCGNTIYIYVYDLNEDCPVDYQNLKPEWNANIYTKKMEY